MKFGLLLKEPIISLLNFKMANGRHIKNMSWMNFFRFPTAFWASTSSCFRIVSDTLVSWIVTSLRLSLLHPRHMCLWVLLVNRLWRMVVILRIVSMEVWSQWGDSSLTYFCCNHYQKRAKHLPVYDYCVFTESTLVFCSNFEKLMNSNKNFGKQTTECWF